MRRSSTCSVIWLAFNSAGTGLGHIPGTRRTIRPVPPRSIISTTSFILYKSDTLIDLWLLQTHKIKISKKHDNISRPMHVFDSSNPYLKKTKETHTYTLFICLQSFCSKKQSLFLGQLTRDYLRLGGMLTSSVHKWIHHFNRLTNHNLKSLPKGSFISHIV